MQTYREDLQVLRGFSVILVLLYHLQIKGFGNGYLGVDIFFVLSGFLMALLAEKTSPLEFYKRRLRRLLPAYLATIFLTTIAVLFISIPVDANQRLDRLWFDLFGLSNIAFWLENSYFSAAAFKPLLNLWSLGVELQFYLIAPFLLPLLRKRLVVLIALIFCSLVFSLFVLTISPKTSFFMMPTRLWEFFAGALIAWYPITFRTKLTKTIIGYIALLILIGVLFLYPLEDNSLSIYRGHPGIASILIVVATSLIIAIKLEEIIDIGNVIGRILIRIGDYSYSIYLTHFPIIVLVNYAAFGGTIIGFESMKGLLLIIVLTFITSFLMYNYVEVFRGKKQSKLLLATLSAGIISVGVFGSHINQSGYSSAQNRIFGAWEDRAYYRCGKMARIIAPTETTCRLGAVDNNNRVLLLGNSHADAIKVSFADVMDANDFSTYFYVANNPLMSSGTNAKNLANDVTRLNIRSVVIHFSPTFYDDNKNIERLKNFNKLMKENDVNVFFIAPVPVYDVHIPRAMIEHSYESDYSLPNQNIDTYFKNSAKFFDYVHENKIGQSKIFSPHEALCLDRLCVFEDNNTPYYFDSDHLTISGSKKLIPMFNDLAMILKLNN